MNPQQVSILVLTSTLGLGVLGSYIPIVKDFKQHDYWVGIPPALQTTFYVFWVLAALGFLWYVASHLFFTQKDDRGLFAYGAWIRPLLIGIMLIGSILWSVFVWGHFNKQWNKGWTVLSLIVVALCTILLLAGEAEANAPWHRILGLMCFAMTTILIDSVMWNAKFLLS